MDVIRDSAGFQQTTFLGAQYATRISVQFVTNLSFEFALYRRMHQQSVKIGLWRKGAGPMTMEMNLRE